MPNAGVELKLCLYFCNQSVVLYCFILSLNRLFSISLQPPVEFHNLKLTRVHQVYQSKCDLSLLGICFDESKLYCVEQRTELVKGKFKFIPRLAVYDTSSARDGSLTRMDKVDVVLDTYWGCQPTADNTHQIFVPCNTAGIVAIFRCEGGRLQPARDPLTCVEIPGSLAVGATGALYVCGDTSQTVCLVYVCTDTDTATCLCWGARS